MKEVFERPEVTVYEFEVADVICTSSCQYETDIDPNG